MTVWQLNNTHLTQQTQSDPSSLTEFGVGVEVVCCVC